MTLRPSAFNASSSPLPSPKIHDLRPGSLVARFRKCGKRSCHCTHKGDKGHGPSYSLTHPIVGKTITHIIPIGPAVDRTREQLDEYHRFRELVQRLVTVSEQINNCANRPALLTTTLKKPRSTVCSQLRSCTIWRPFSDAGIWIIWTWKHSNQRCADRCLGPVKK